MSITYLDSKRLYEHNITSYIRKNYDCNFLDIQNSKLLDVDSFLQKDYGETGDCSVTSIATLLYYLSINHEFIDVYNVVEQVARKYEYRGGKGTNPLRFSRIIKEAAKILDVNLTKIYGRYFKNVFYTFDEIKDSIDSKMPVLLSFLRDGRKYYNNHSVLIVGYETYKKNDKEYPILYILDNWNKEPSCIDFTKLGFISSINLVSM